MSLIFSLWLCVNSSFGLDGLGKGFLLKNLSTDTPVTSASVSIPETNENLNFIGSLFKNGSPVVEDLSTQLSSLLSMTVQKEEQCAIVIKYEDVKKSEEMTDIFRKFGEGEAFMMVDEAAQVTPQPSVKPGVLLTVSLQVLLYSLTPGETPTTTLYSGFPTLIVCSLLKETSQKEMDDKLVSIIGAERIQPFDIQIEKIEKKDPNLRDI